MDGSHPSITDIFTIGIGPASSHTVGPMRAAFRFRTALENRPGGGDISRLEVHLFGSLALTGKGHGTDRAVTLGLAGNRPSRFDVERAAAIEAEVYAQGLDIAGQTIAFPAANIVFHADRFLDEHPNGMTFRAQLAPTGTVFERTYLSIGGGVVQTVGDDDPVAPAPDCPCPFETAAALLDLCTERRMTVAQMMMANETVWRAEADTVDFLDRVDAAMNGSVERGCRTEGCLPGGLEVPRRAPALYRDLKNRSTEGVLDPLAVLDWVNLYALAVNEENAGGGRVVTPPTNGAAGILPAVLRYYENFCPQANRQGTRDFLLTAAAIAILYKKGASISAAEVGCQGEVGVACSMAAGALTAVLGGTVAQIENAAEIGMEHNLGLTELVPENRTGC